MLWSQFHLSIILKLVLRVWLQLVLVSTSSVDSSMTYLLLAFRSGLSDHTWHQAPNMQVARTSLQANAVNGKIYVTGGCKDCNSSNYMEVFDPKTQIWEPVLCPLKEKRCESRIYNSAAIEGEIVLFGKKNVAYKPKEDRWEVIGNDYRYLLGRSALSSCTIGNVLYCYYMLTKIKWYHSKWRCWLDVMGLEGLSRFSGYDLVRMVDYGGKMVVLWDKYLPSSSGNKEKEIWCAVIALERRNNNHEIWGNIEWFDPLLTVPRSCGFVCALAATV